MPTTLTNGIQLPDKGSVDWYSSMQSNYNLIDTHLGDTDIHVTTEDKSRWDGKANASHTHTSSELTDIGDYATKQYVDTSISGLVDNAPAALDTLKELSTALNDDANFASTVTTALSAKANSADLATVATSGSYNDLSNKPTINDSTITIQKNGSTVDTFTTNGSNKTINIPVPTKTSDLTNDSNFVDTSNSAVASGITSTKVTDYDTHIADTDIHVTSADKTTWNTVTSKADDNNVMHLSGNETANGEKTFRSDLTVANTDTTANIPNLNLRNYKADRGTVETSVQTIMFSDKNAKALTLLESRRLSNGNTSTNILCYNTDDNNNTVSGGVSVIRTKTATNFAPNADNTVTCGRPLAKWSDVQTYQINGLTPSSLSLPSTTGVLDIRSYITDLTGTANTYTVLVNGYIQFDVTGSSVEIDVTNGLSQKWIMTDPKGFIPVVSGASVSIKVVGTAINNFKFIPCQGNV